MTRRSKVENEIRNLHEMTRGKYEIAGSISHSIMGCSFEMDLKTRRIKIKPATYDMIEYTMYVAFQYCYARLREAASKVYPRVQKVLDDLLSWFPEDAPEFFRPPEVRKVKGSIDGSTAMMLIESGGFQIKECSQPHLLAAYLQGKACREFTINQWLEGYYSREADQRLFFLEEYNEHAGFTDELSIKLFGRKPDRNITC